MVQKIFLALDFETSTQAIEKGKAALGILRDGFGATFVDKKVGVKVNEDMFTDVIDRKFGELSENLFADRKIAHGIGTGSKMISKVKEALPNMQYVTVSAGLGTTILKEYVSTAEEHEVKVIAFTLHTKIPPEDANTMYGGLPLDDIVYNLSYSASAAKCDSVVMEAERLNNQGIRELPIKKLVTGIRVDPIDKAGQSRVTSFEQLIALREEIDYIVVSSRYLADEKILNSFIVNSDIE